jgi:membrane associated rhomboid family serine protease
MAKKVSKEMVLGLYFVMILIFVIIGYAFGKVQAKKSKSDKSESYAITGAVIGLVMSVILWFTMGKKMTE